MECKRGWRELTNVSLLNSWLQWADATKECGLSVTKDGYFLGGARQWVLLTSDCLVFVLYVVTQLCPISLQPHEL